MDKNYHKYNVTLHRCYIQWLKEEFLGYLSDWEESINKRDGYSDEEKAKMIISQDTLKGLRMTGK